MASKIRIYQVDAFSTEVFQGNPAAVCPLESWPADKLLQSIAAENNLSETAFYVPASDGFEIRWFSPTVEVDLCGHATLATAFVLFEFEGHAKDTIVFHSRKSGTLKVSRKQQTLALDFPEVIAKPADPNPALVRALGLAPAQLHYSNQYMAVYENESQVRGLQPDMAALTAMDETVIVTAPATDCDFVSRFFAPSKGIPEDPVTGSAHCTLAPYWATYLGKSILSARQVSSRGGALTCRIESPRVIISGHARCYMQGHLYL